MILTTIILFGLLMALVFTGLLAVQYLLGSSHSVRDEAGNFDLRRSPLGLLMVIIVFSLMIGIPVVANAWLAARVGTQPFLTYFLVSYGVFFFVNLWDLVVLDYILIVRFRPSFLTLLDTPYYTTIQPHIKGWFRGLVIGLLTSLVAAAISLWLL